jgi:hypothetical protein
MIIEGRKYNVAVEDLPMLQCGLGLCLIIFGTKNYIGLLILLTELRN